MIATWMLYATLVGLLTTVAAFGLERGGRALGAQVRFVWVGALATTFLWPVAAYRLAAARPIHSAPAAIAQPGVLAPLESHGDAAAITWRDRLPSVVTITDALDPVLSVLWGAASLFLLFRLARSAEAIRRGRRNWRTRTVDGARVLLSNDVGPAVIGIRDLRIVIPQWTLGLGVSERAVILLHEEEHRRARDPHLLLAAILASAIAPWNLAVWWQCRRLRLAIETDCDARVLRRERDVERYGSLLVAIAARRGPQAPVIAAALTETISNLERRITIMTTPTPRFPRMTAGALAAVAVGAILLASVAPVPPAIAASPISVAAPDVGQAAPASVAVQQPRVYLSTEVDVKARVATTALSPAYPPGLRDSQVQGRVVAQFVVRPDGRADLATFKAVTSPRASFTSSIRTHVAALRFDPALKNGTRVSQLVEMPFDFKLVGATTVAATAPLVSSDAGADPTINTTATYDPTPTVKRAVAASDVINGLGPDPIRQKVSDVDDGRIAAATAGAYFDFQVEQQVRPTADNRAPDYPPLLRQANVEGAVTMQFVVGIDGRVEPETVKEVKSTHALFTSSIKTHLPAMRFTPAMVGGVPVRQVVQMPFVFTLSR